MIHYLNPKFRLRNRSDIFRFLVTVILTVSAFCSANAAVVVDTLTVNIYFRQGSAVFDTQLSGNLQSLGKMGSIINSDSIFSINIKSSASPEGNTLFNKQLSVDRTSTALRLLDSLGIYSSKITTKSIGTDWTRLADILDQYDSPVFARKAASIIRDTPEWIIENGVVTDSRKLRLRKLRDGEAWDFMLDNIFPSLRVSNITLTYRHSSKLVIESLESYLTLPVSCHVTDSGDIIPHETLSVRRNSRHCYLALRTNLLYDAAAVPNLGLILPLAKGWSVSADAYYADWTNSADKRHWRIQGAELAVRKQLMPPPQTLGS